MKTFLNVSLVILASTMLLFPAGAGAQNQGLQSLRGQADLEETTSAAAPNKPATDRRLLSRAYRQQPPLIPHSVDKYQINVKVNQCMRCHDWPYNVEEGAPKISETHYTNRDGVALDRVAGTRWFCNQCHVPQLNAPTLVENDFKSAFGVD